jgi:hypothetical protein
MAAETKLLYLEPDDEITSVVRRLRETDGDARVVLVASARTRATSSATALRLLARLAEEEGREIALVADPAARALAGEAGIVGFASVADATRVGATPAEPPTPMRASIHVVRDEPVGDVSRLAAPPVTPAAPAAAPPAAVAPPPGSLDQTQVVPVAVPARPQPATAPRPAAARARSGSRRALAVGLLLLVLLLAAATTAGAILLPAATIHIVPATVGVGPERYEVSLPVRGVDEVTFGETARGTASGTHVELVRATGAVTFLNWGGVAVEVLAGTSVSVDSDVFFTTDNAVAVPPAQFLPDGRVQAGEASAAITAAEGGPAGNVGSRAIDTIEDRRLVLFLRGLPNNRARLVLNPEPTTGGAENEEPQVKRGDVKAVVEDLTDALRRRLARHLDASQGRIYPPFEVPEPEVTVPEDLIGSTGEKNVELSGTVAFSQPWAQRSDALNAGRERMMDDGHAVPAGSELLAETIEVRLVGEPRLAGDAIVVAVRVSAQASRRVDENAIRTRLAGKSSDQVRAALAEVGDATVEFWPSWVDRVPGIESRIEIRVEPVRTARSGVNGRSGG